jgi:hypothetical protein
MIWKREKPSRELPPRVRKLDTNSLLMWMDTTIMNVHQAFEGWRYHNKPIEQIGESIDVLNDLWEEICSRGLDKD